MWIGIFYLAEEKNADAVNGHKYWPLPLCQRKAMKNLVRFAGVRLKKESSNDHFWSIFGTPLNISFFLMFLTGESRRNRKMATIWFSVLTHCAWTIYISLRWKSKCRIWTFRQNVLWRINLRSFIRIWTSDTQNER